MQQNTQVPENKVRYKFSTNYIKKNLIAMVMKLILQTNIKKIWNPCFAHKNKKLVLKLTSEENGFWIKKYLLIEFTILCN